MHVSSSTALVPVGPKTNPAEAISAKSSSGCGGSRKGLGNRRKWLMVVSIGLALVGVALGSVWFGFAAILPLLYLVPCLLMVMMCMRGMNANGRPSDSNSQ